MFPHTKKMQPNASLSPLTPSISLRALLLPLHVRLPEHTADTPVVYLFIRQRLQMLHKSELLADIKLFAMNA